MYITLMLLTVVTVMYVTLMFFLSLAFGTSRYACAVPYSAQDSREPLCRFPSLFHRVVSSFLVFCPANISRLNLPKLQHVLAPLFKSLLCAVVLKVLPGRKLGGDHRAHLLWYFFLREHYPMLPIVKCLKKGCFRYFVYFSIYLQWESRSSTKCCYGQK